MELWKNYAKEYNFDDFVAIDHKNNSEVAMFKTYRNIYMAKKKSLLS